jgi:hypothetical protein
LPAGFKCGLRFQVPNQRVPDLLDQRSFMIVAHMMRSGQSNPLRRLGTAVFAILAVQGFCAPVSARAGCNHLVTSEIDSDQQASMFGGFPNDVASRTDPLQQPPRPCTGAWCDRQPATPAVPAGVFDGVIESWACWNPNPCHDLSGTSFISRECVVLHPSQRKSLIFHPPRPWHAA